MSYVNYPLISRSYGPFKSAVEAADFARLGTILSGPATVDDYPIYHPVEQPYLAPREEFSLLPEMDD